MKPLADARSEERSVGMAAPGRILLKKSKIERLRKSRECSALAISAAARRCRIDTRVSDRSCGNSCGPSPRGERDSPAVLRIFSRQRKGIFSTQSGAKRPFVEKSTPSGLLADRSLLRFCGARHLRTKLRTPFLPNCELAITACSRVDFEPWMRITRSSTSMASINERR
jgi:hypothetical protein